MVLVNLVADIFVFENLYSPQMVEMANNKQK